MVDGWGFLDPLDLRLIGWRGGRPLWSTLTPLAYASALLGRTIIVPAEFVTDLASTPRLLPLTWLLASGRAPRPAVVHDLLYQHPEWDDRALADRVFLEAMGADPMSGTNAPLRALMYGGVRVGGWLAWSRQHARRRALNPIWTATMWPEAVEAP